jgi:uncharacterized SAM-binding protein YcdF (DUF218 family)
VAWRALWGALLVAVLVGFVGFQAPAANPPVALAPAAGGLAPGVSGPPNAVVFTGAYDRIDAALDLLSEGRVRRVFISGVNANAGLSPATFVQQFEPRHPQLAALVACCVEMGEAADTTLQNALETSCWVQRRGLSGPLVLITSTAHMARASAALAAVLPDTPIVRVAVPSEGPQRESRLAALEYLKHLATQALLVLPGARALWPARFGTYVGGCG